MNKQHTFSFMQRQIQLYARAVGVILMLVFLIAPVCVKASEILPASAHFSHSHGGVELSLYHAAISQEGVYVPTELFLEAKADFTLLEEEESASYLAGTLYSHVRKMNMEPTHTIVLDEKGEADALNLSEGVYLITSKSYQAGGSHYFVNPSLIQIRPGDNLKVVLKPQSYFVQAQSITIEKIWKDENGQIMDEAPQDEIEAELLKDGEIEQTKVLNDDNDWQGSWSAADSQHWTVMEKEIPEGYKLTIEQEGTHFRLINQKEASSTPDPDPSPDPDPTPDPDPAPQPKPDDPKDPDPALKDPQKPADKAEPKDTSADYGLKAALLMAAAAGIAIIFLTAAYFYRRKRNN